MNSRISLLASHMGYSAIASLVFGTSAVGAVQAAEAPAGSGALSDNAQEGSPRNKLGLEEIVVTAQKREERLQDVPISISVLTGEALDKSTAPDVTELLNRVPGVSVSPVGYSSMSVVTVRGVQAPPLLNGSAATAYYLDSVPFGFVKSALAPDPDVYDLERVEVLRGPQGTLYGASALNGVVRVLTNDADLNEFELKARGSTSSTKVGGWNYRGDMAINVPIVEGKLAARAVLGYQDSSGWIDRPHRKDANDAERRNLRLKLNAQPTAQLSIGVSAALSRYDAGAFSSGASYDQNFTPIDEPVSTDYDAYGLKIGYAFPWFSIVSATSYVDYTNNIFTNQRPFAAPPGTLGLLEEDVLSAETFAEEIILTSAHEGPWRWSLGGMYRDSEDRFHLELLNASRTPLVALEDRDFSKSYAVFGELARTFLDGRLELTGGLRYFEDDVAVRQTLGAPQLARGDTTFSATTPRFVLNWHQAEQMTLYTSYSEGFRSGTFQSSLVAPTLPPVDADTLKNYEIGAKGSLLGGRIDFDTAVYYMDWQDIQQSTTLPLPGGSGFLPGLINGGSASGAGIDFGVTIRPVDAFELDLSLSWNDLTSDEDIINSGFVIIKKGERLANSAEYTAGASASYVFALGTSGFEGRLSASGNYTSERPAPMVFLGAPGVIPNDDMLITGANFSVEGSDHWTATLFVDNLSNYRDSVSRHAARHEWNIRMRPRTVGVQFEYRF